MTRTEQRAARTARLSPAPSGERGVQEHRLADPGPNVCHHATAGLQRVRTGIRGHRAVSARFGFDSRRWLEGER